MRIYSIFLLVISSAFAMLAYAETVETCPVPAPFQLLDKTMAEKYPLDELLAKSTSPYSIDAVKTDQAGTNSAAPVQLLNFWAAWCAPCRQELPLLDKIQGDKVANIILINVGDKQAMAEKILSELAVKHLKTRLADSDILSAFSIMGLPASMVFNDGKVYLGMGRLKDETAITNWLGCLSN